MEDVNLMRWSIASLGLIVVMLAFALIARKVGPVSLKGVTGERRMKIQEVLHLDTRNKLYIVEVDGEEKLVGVGVNQISSLPRKNQSSK